MCRCMCHIFVCCVFATQYLSNHMGVGVRVFQIEPYVS